MRRSDSFTALPVEERRVAVVIFAGCVVLSRARWGRAARRRELGAAWMVCRDGLHALPREGGRRVAVPKVSTGEGELAVLGVKPRVDAQRVLALCVRQPLVDDLCTQESAAGSTDAIPRAFLLRVQQTIHLVVELVRARRKLGVLDARSVEQSLQRGHFQLVPVRFAASARRSCTHHQHHATL